MADITKCSTEKCKHSKTCYRKTAWESKYQSWSDFDCKDKEFYWGNK
jgi:hypothetical protein